MIKIYPNKLDAGGEAFETHATNRRMTLGAWLNSIRKEGYKPGDALPLSVTVNDEIIDQRDWFEVAFKPRDDVNFYIEPKGTDPISMAAAIFGAVKAVFGMLMPKLPGTPNQPGQGDSLSQASVNANRVKMGDVIRESFGTQRIFGDYLLPPHRYFTDPVTQWVELMLCIGRGRYQIQDGAVRIGDTSILSLGADAEYQIFQPGEAVSGLGSIWWHTAAEVGASSTGAAGLELTDATAITPSASASAFQFSGNTITIPAGAGSFPADWTVGQVLRIIAPYSYTVTDGGGAVRDVVSGPLSMLNPTVGDQIEVVGANSGKYTVQTYTPGTPGQMTLNYEWGAAANQLAAGTSLATIGPVGLHFKITSITSSVMTVDRLKSSGALDPSFPGFVSATMSNASIAIDTSSLQGGWRGGFPACPPKEKTTKIELDVMYPNGLGGVGQDGFLFPLSVSYEVQWRDMALGTGAAWTSVAFSDMNTTLNQVGYTKHVDLPYAMRPEVRMRKTSPLGENLEFRDTIQWYGLKSLLQAPTSYPGATAMRVRVRTSDRIAAQTESKISVIATRMLPTRADGAWTDEIATRDIAPVFAYIAKSLGYTDSGLDLDALDELDALWKARGDKFDGQFTSASTAKEAMNDVLGVGYAELTVERGALSPVRDGIRNQLEHMYTPQNMTRALVREIQLVQPSDFGGVDVTYTDPDSWTEEFVECRLSGVTSGRIEKIKATGITDETRAWRLGMRRLRSHWYRRDSYSWSTELDALNSRYMSYDMVADDVPGYGQSALMLDYENSGDSVTIESSEPFDWTTGENHKVAIRRPDGTVSGPYTATKVDEYTLTIPSIDFTPDVSWEKEPPHLLFGPSNRLSYPVLVMSVTPNGSAAASVEAIGYNPLVYADDDNSPP